MLIANACEPMIAPCVSALRAMLAIISGGSTLMLAIAFAVMPASSGPWRALTTATPVAKRAIRSRRRRRSISSIGDQSPAVAARRWTARKRR